MRQGYAAIRSSLGWRESKAESIQKLFDLVESDESLTDAERGVVQFVDLLNTEGFKRRWVGKKINKIRNMLVHHEDFDDGEVLDVAEADFRELSLYLAKVVSALSVRFDEALRAV